MEHKLTFRQYSDALKENKLLGLKCKECGIITVPPKIACRNCASTDMDITELSGKGNIQTYTVVNVASEGREDEVPYVLTLVELDEGPWILGNITDTDPTQLSMDIIGKRVTMGSSVFAGDKFSAGEGARVLFTIEA